MEKLKIYPSNQFLKIANFAKLQKRMSYCANLSGKGGNIGGDPALQRPILVRTSMQENPYACIKRNKEWNNDAFFGVKILLSLSGSDLVDYTTSCFFYVCFHYYFSLGEGKEGLKSAPKG